VSTSVSSRQPWETWHKDMWEQTFGLEQAVDVASRWPDGIRVAVMLTYDTQGDVDAAVPGYQNGTCYWDEDNINYNDLSQRQYDARRGVERILRILGKYDIRATFPTTGVTAEWYPDVIGSIAEAGHEVAVHGYRHVPLYKLSDAGERNEIAQGKEAVEAVTGRPARGWRSPMYSSTKRTIRLLTELGFTYDSSFHNDDWPYALDNDGSTLIEIPAGLDDWELNLMKVPGGISMGGQSYAAPSAVTDTLVSHFDMLYEESAEGPRMMQYCMHPKITGRPHRAYGLQRFIEYVGGQDGVWFCAMEDLAELCLVPAQA